MKTCESELYAGLSKSPGLVIEAHVFPCLIHSSRMSVYPRSLAELTDMYDVSDPASTNVATPMLLEIHTEADRNHTLLLDVIYVSCVKVGMDTAFYSTPLLV